MDDQMRNTIRHRAAMVAQGICPCPLNASSYERAAYWLAVQDVPALLEKVERLEQENALLREAPVTEP